MAHGELDEESLNELYTWVDAIPLSRPKRNIARDFSDGVLVAEVVKFYFPKLVEMHNYAPANSTQQKLSNWGHLNRKVLNKLNFSIPEEVVRKIAQCTPGVVELVLIPLRQKIEEKQRQAKISSNSYQELGTRSGLEESNYLDTEFPPTLVCAFTAHPFMMRHPFPPILEFCQKQMSEDLTTCDCKQKKLSLFNHGISSKPKPNSTGMYTQDFPGSEKGTRGLPGRTGQPQADPNFSLHLAEREQALLASQEAIQILQMKVRRLEHLLHLKNVRIDDLSRRLQQIEQKQK